MWDIHDKFGDTNLLVTSIAQGDDLAFAPQIRDIADAAPVEEQVGALANLQVPGGSEVALADGVVLGQMGQEVFRKVKGVVAARTPVGLARS